MLRYPVKRHSVFEQPAVVRFELHAHQVGHYLGWQPALFSMVLGQLDGMVERGGFGLFFAVSHGAAY